MLILEAGVNSNDVANVYQQNYQSSSFVKIVTKEPSTSQVKQTNHCCIYPKVVNEQPQKMIIVSVIDNLIKGASGQAVQNMNLMFGLDASAGFEL